ncbi:MAG: signal peptidase I [Gammaproteobacteria bacterium]|nr:signal peptidase I [Gammaproteobacteria bacterium]
MLIYLGLFIVTAVVSLIDIIHWAPKRRLTHIEKAPSLIESARVIFVILLLYGLYQLFFADLNISYYFPIALVLVTVLTGIIYGLDKLFWAKKRHKGKRTPALVDFSRSFFPVFFAVLLIRSFIVQPYRVPTGSLEPTVLPNDFLLVTQYSYGLRLPITNTRFIKISEPKRGEIAVFHFPVDPTVDYVKRIIGLPGDHIVYKDKTLYVNGVKAQQRYISSAIDYEDGADLPAKLYEENLLGVKHSILINPDKEDNSTYDFIVPQGMYFAMGDNRDDSFDSRAWGFVPEENLVGQAKFILLSYDNKAKKLRWSRFGERLK